MRRPQGGNFYSPVTNRRRASLTFTVAMLPKLNDRGLYFATRLAKSRDQWLHRPKALGEITRGQTHEAFNHISRQRKISEYFCTCLCGAANKQIERPPQQTGLLSGQFIV